MSILQPTTLELASYGTPGWNAIFSSNFQKINTYMARFQDLWTGLGSSDDGRVIVYSHAQGRWVKITPPWLSGSLTANRIPRFVSGTTVADSQIFDNGTNVGIGLINPQSKLDVAGDINIPGTAVIRIDGSAGSSGQVLTRTSTGMTWATGGGGGGGIGGGGSTNYIPKFTAVTTIENSQITDTGTNVGIGVANPQAKLDIGGDINVPSNAVVRVAGDGGNVGQVLTRTATGMTWATVTEQGMAETFPAGMITSFARFPLPSGWLICNGSAISRTTYANLFNAIGTRYGSGDGSTTFNLPQSSFRVDVNGAIFLNDLPVSRSGHSLTLLPDGRLLILGGYDGSTSRAETYFGTISGNTISWVQGNNMPVTRYSHRAILLPDGRILLTGGVEGTTTRNDTYFGTISGNTISWMQGSNLPAARAHHALFLLPDGRILIVGGHDGSSTRAESWFGTISGNTISWTTGTSLSAVRHAPAYVLLSDDRILIAGGFDGSTARAETYLGLISGNTITWTTSTSLPFAINNASAILLPNNRVFVGSSEQRREAFLGTVIGNIIIWITADCVLSQRRVYGMALLPDGRVLMTGGGTGTTWPPNATNVVQCYIIGYEGIKT